MKETLLILAKYNQWANSRIIDVLLTLDDAQLTAYIKSSFPSIKATVYHTWSAEYIWLQRLQLQENPIWAEAAFAGTFAEACAEWKKTSDMLTTFVARQFDDNAFTHVFQYYNLKKQSVKNTVHTTLLHVFNHSTYHRGQLVTMLRQSGVVKIPSTDIIVFAGK